MGRRSFRPVVVLYLAAVLTMLASACCSADAADMKRGADLFWSERYDEAISAFTSAAAADSSLAPTAQRMIAVCSFYKGEYDKAMRMLTKVLTDCPASKAAADMQRGNDLYWAEQYDEAISAFTSAVAADAAVSPSALRMLGVCHLYKGDPAKAMEIFNKLLADFPTSEAAAEAPSFIALCYEHQGRAEDVIAQYKKHVLEYPDNVWTPDVMVHLSDRLTDKGAYDEALAFLGKVINEHPKLAQHARAHLAEAYLAQGKYDQAIAVAKERLEAAEAAWPGEKAAVKDPRYQLAECYRRADRGAEAIAGYQTLMADFPQDAVAVEAEYQIAWTTLNGLRDASRAKSLFEAFVAAHPDYANMAEAKSQQAFCSVMLGDHAAARDMYKALMEAYASDPSWRRTFKLLLGSCQIELKEYEEARQTLSEFMAEYPDTVDAQAAAEWYLIIRDK